VKDAAQDAAQDVAENVLLVYEGHFKWRFTTKAKAD